MLKYIEIDGKRYAWKDIVRLRREQTAGAHQKQEATLFDLRYDCRPASQQTAAGRYKEPTLFEVD
jgi:hypothetical protein